jgi:hypothetical protein
VGRVGIEGDVFVEPVEQAVQQAQPIGLVHAGCERLHRRVGVGQRGLAQKKARRKALDRVAHHPVGILRFNDPGRGDGQIGERRVGRERVDDVAERIFLLVEAAIGRDLDPPVEHELALVVARGQPQRLDHAGRRRVVVVVGLVPHADTHAGIMMVTAALSSRRRLFRGSGQILFRDRGVEFVVVDDEFGDELMQAVLEDLGHAAVLEPCVHSAA